VGEEVEDLGGGELAIVGAPYGAHGQSVGTIGVIGPTRMDYSRVVPLVAATANAMSEFMDRGERGRKEPEDHGEARCIDGSIDVDIDTHLEELAASFCLGSARLQETETPPPPLPNLEGFQPLSSFLTGPALVSKATQILHAATRDYEEAAGTELPLVAPLPLF